MRIKRWWGMLVLVAVAALAGCTGLPTSGTVNPGNSEEIDAPPAAFLPDEPQVGSSPQQIVSDFIAAASSPAENWRIAKLFLTDDAAQTWEPDAGVIVDNYADRNWDAEGETSIELTVSPVAQVDVNGAYAAVDQGSIPLDYTLTQREDGEWRISGLPDGILLDEPVFSEVYSQYPVMFFDPGWNYLVPDVRWFPARSNVAYRITQAVLGEPSTWLAGAVQSAFPEDVVLSRSSVPVDADAVAHVELDADGIDLQSAALNRMQRQLSASLEGAGVSRVQMSIAGAPIDVTASEVRSTAVNTLPLVQTKDGVGYLASGELDSLGALSTAIRSVRAASIELITGGQQAAVRTDEGVVARIGADVTEVDTRPGLIDPTTDPNGAIWSVPRSDPGAVRIAGVTGEPQVVSQTWQGASEISAMQLSRDGTRIIASIKVSGAWQLVAAGVLRDEEGNVTGLGAFQSLANLDAAARALAWVDNARVAAVTPTDEASLVLEQTIGGRGATTRAPEGITSMAGANAATVIRLLDGDGVLYLKRGSTWQRVSGGIDILATQQGPSS